MQRATSDDTSESQVLSALPAQPDQVRLRSLSAVADFDEELGEFVLEAGGDPRAGLIELLDRAASAGLFEVAGCGDGRRWSWPEPVRAAVHGEFVQRSAEQARELDLRLAGWYLARRQPGRALAHAMAGPDWPTVATVLEAGWHQLPWSHPMETARALLTMPASTLQASMLLRSLHSAVPGSGVPVSSLPAPPLLTPEQLQEVASGDQARRTLDLFFSLTISYRLKGALTQSNVYGEQVVAIVRIARESNAPGVTELLTGGYLQGGQTRLLRGEYDAAISLLEDSYALGPLGPNAFAPLFPASELSLTHALRGDVEDAVRWLARVQEAPQLAGMLASLIKPAAFIAQVLLAVDELDSGQASKALDSLAPGPLNDEFWAFRIHAKTAFALGWGDRTGMLDELRQTRATHPSFEELRRSGGVADPLLAAAEANLLLSMRHGNQAWAVVNYNANRHPALQVARARVAVLAGDAAGGLEIVQSVAAADPATALDLMLVRALALLRLGRQTEAIETFAAAVEQCGPRRVFAFAAVPRADLVALIEQTPTAARLLTEDVLARLPDLYPAGVAVLHLTPQEHLVLVALVDGKTIDELAAELHLAPSTMKSHRRNLYRKLAVNSRDAAVLAAHELGLVGPLDEHH